VSQLFRLKLMTLGHSFRRFVFAAPPPTGSLSEIAESVRL
jgi:hypothetical protein